MRRSIGSQCNLASSGVASVCVVRLVVSVTWPAVVWHQCGCKLVALHGQCLLHLLEFVDVELRDAVENAVCIFEPEDDQCLSNGFGDFIVDGVPNMTEGSKMKVR